jgi:hypothetical protein
MVVEALRDGKVDIAKARKAERINDLFPSVHAIPTVREAAS